ncbi:MAG: GIY-YIG nuclease family protein [Rickettsiales bacterium]|nr:GIY-YIG nuclease family protein [Rickettsiales bacterium]
MKQESENFNFWVYILFNERAKATYIGMTNNLERRMIEHKMGLLDGFTKEKSIKKLGYYEFHQYVEDAIKREKQLKKWNRAWKYRLIETKNPEWNDLAACLEDYIAKMPKMEIKETNGLQAIVPANDFKTLFPLPSPCHSREGGNRDYKP